MVFLKISQNSQEKTCARASFFNKAAGLRLKTFIKKDQGYDKKTFTYIKEVLYLRWNEQH